MSDYNDETNLTDEEVAEAIANAKAKKKAEKNRKNKRFDKKSKSLDAESSNDLLNESNTAAQLEDEEDETPAMKSAKSFSNAFSEAKKKREKDLLTKKVPEKSEPSDSEDDEDDDDNDDEKLIASVPDDDEDVDFDDDEYEYEEDDDEEESEDDDDEDEYEYEYEEDDDDEDDEDDEEIVEEDDEDDEEDEDEDGIFETDDENAGYVTAVDVDDDDENDEDDDDEEEEEEEDDSTFSTKTKVIIGIIIAILVVAIVFAIGAFMKGTGGNNKNTSSVVSAVEGEITSVKFAESSISIKVGETTDLKIVVEPADAKDKTFKLKSNDETIAKVTEEGKVIGIASGSTTITATLKSNPTMTASIVVNVIDEEQSTLNTFNKFVNDVIDGTTDIDPDSETDTEESDSEEQEGDEDSEKDSESDTDTAKKVKIPSHILTGNKIEDFDSDGELELALYYEPNTDNAEPLVRIFRMASEDEEVETDSEEEVQYDEFGNVIESTNSDKSTEEDKTSDKDKSSAEKKLTEVEQYTERYMTIYSSIESTSASTPWNTTYLEIKEGEQATARVKILSAGYKNPTYTYESEDEEIATVDAQGNIKGVKPGTVFITVGSALNSEATAKIKVRIKDDTDLLDDYLADIPVVNSTNDSVFPTETLTGKAIVDIDNDGVSELLLRFQYSDNVETINMIKVENEKCVCYKTYNNLSDLYEYNEGNGSYTNSILVHYTTGKVCMDYKAVTAKEGSQSKATEEKILSIESGGTLSELVNFRTTTDITTKKVTSEVIIDNRTTSSTSSEEESDSDYEYEEESDSDEQNDTTSHIDEDEDGYDDETGEYFGSYAAFTFDEIEANGIDMTNKKPEKILPQVVAAPDDEDEDNDDTTSEDEDNDNDTASQNDDDDDEPVTSRVTTEVTEETTKYFVNGTPVDQSVYEEVLTRYSATYSVWSAWEPAGN